MTVTQKDIELFIEIMKTAVNEDWTPEQVQEKYGDCETLKEAVYRNMNAVSTALDDLKDMVTKDLEQS